MHRTLLQDLTQVSATQTGWHRTHRSGEGKIIALYDPGICFLRFRIFRNHRKFPAIFPVKKGRVHMVESNLHPLDFKASPLPLDHGYLMKN
jgi:hypothetical protein